MKVESFIISGFPGIGKTHLCNTTGWSDSDSSQFSWLNKERHPDWPNNYIQHIKEQKTVTLVSSHKEVRDALAAANLAFFVCYPEKQCKADYIERYKRRGSPEKFIELLDNMWYNWLEEMINETRAKVHFVLGPYQYISDIKF